jgi:ABC-2 type transport system ATP-binding protein
LIFREIRIWNLQKNSKEFKTGIFLHERNFYKIILILKKVPEDNIVEIKSLRKVYEDKTVLRNISFSVERGTIHGFIGPNGAGKTTTLKCLMNGVKPSGGEIYLLGQKIRQDEFVNQKIGFMTERVRFSNNMRVDDLIHLAGKLRDIHPYETERRLRKSDLNNHRYKKCGELSTG